MANESKKTYEVSHEDLVKIYSALDEAHQTAINLQHSSFGNQAALRARQRAEINEAMGLIEKHHKPF